MRRLFISFSVIAFACIFTMQAENLKEDESVKVLDTVKIQKEFQEALMEFGAIAATNSTTDMKSVFSEKLTYFQKETFIYARKLVNRLNGKIALPLEINALIGDTITKEQYRAVPLWAYSHFENSPDYEAHLVIPMNVKTLQGSFISCLNIRYSKNLDFYRTVETIFNFQDSNKENFSGIIVKSNVFGFWWRSFIYENDILKEQIEGVIGSLGYGDYRHSPSGGIPKRRVEIEDLGSSGYRYVSKIKDKYGNPAHWLYGQAFFDRFNR